MQRELNGFWLGKYEVNNYWMQSIGYIPRFRSKSNYLWEAMFHSERSREFQADFLSGSLYFPVLVQHLDG